MAARVMVFDTTLRDGEQAAGSRLGVEEKVQIARQLARLGVDVIEAGFPCSSPQDFKAVQMIAREVREPVICGLTRAVSKDIDICGKALAGAARGRIHTGLGVSDIHLMGKFGADKYGTTLMDKRQQTIAMAVAAVRHARRYTDDVEFYAEDAGRADRDYLVEVVTAVIEAGVTVVNIPDTTGYTAPIEYGQLIADIGRRVPNIHQAMISVHCHNDLGMAVANTLAGVGAGARQVEVTINGIGERAGNAALEEVVMALRTRHDLFKADTAINSRELYRSSRMVADKLGMVLPANKAVVGDNAFAHSSGIHVDGFLKDRATYEIMQPEKIGFPETGKVVLTARTGRHGVRHRLEELGFSFSAEELELVYQRFLHVADQKCEVFDEDLAAIVNDEIRSVPSIFELVYLQAKTATGVAPTVTIGLCKDDKEHRQTAVGDGLVDAAYKALAQAIGRKPILERYEIKAVTGGTEAMGKVTVCLLDEDVKVIGQGASTDIIEASVKAYLDAANKLFAMDGMGVE